MTPKEKAQELVKSFAKTIKPITYGYGVLIERDWRNAKQCALIAVNEILTSKQTAYPNQVIELGQVFYSYWQEVKTELENL